MKWIWKKTKMMKGISHSIQVYCPDINPNSCHAGSAPGLILLLDLSSCRCFSSFPPAGSPPPPFMGQTLPTLSFRRKKLKDTCGLFAENVRKNKPKPATCFQKASKKSKKLGRFENSKADLRKTNDSWKRRTFRSRALSSSRTQKKT